MIASAQLTPTLDTTIVNVALPSMERSLHLPLSHLNWVASFYALSFGGAFLLAGARAGDLYGRLRLFRVGLVVFAVALMAGGLAPNGTVLISARLVQGIGAAMAVPAPSLSSPPLSRPGRPVRGPRRLRLNGRGGARRACCSEARSPSTSAGAG